MRQRRPAAPALFAAVVALGCVATTLRVRLSDPSPLSAPEQFGARRGVRLGADERAALAYELSSESFELYAPASAPAGAGLVWVSPGRSGAPPRSWARALDHRGVIWIGANGAGNHRAPPDRIHLALDAAQHLRGLLGADGAPIYVGGFSGGARIASEAALLYPDVFAGGLFAGAADYFRYVRSSDPRWNAWEPTFPPPSSGLLARALRGRYVFVTGARDPNRALVHDVHRAYLVDGFSAAAFLEIPDLGHDLPPPACFELALAALLSAAPPDGELSCAT